jgi:hypothetical protein
MKVVFVSIALVALTIGIGSAWGLVGSDGDGRTAKRPTHASRIQAARLEAPTFLAEIAKGVATRSGDPTPLSAEFVSTTRQLAVGVDGPDTVDTNEPVFYVVLHGDFVHKYARVPVGQPLPRGSVVAITVDAVSRDILDYSISDKPRAIAQLGHPVALDLGTAG